MSDEDDSVDLEQAQSELWESLDKAKRLVDETKWLLSGEPPTVA